MDYDKIASYIRDLRISRGYEIKDISRICDVSEEQVGLWETGDVLPEIDILQRLSKLYDVTINDILEGKETLFGNKFKIVNVILSILSVILLLVFTFPFFSLSQNDYSGFSIILGRIDTGDNLMLRIVMLVLISQVTYSFLVLFKLVKDRVMYLYGMIFVVIGNVIILTTIFNTYSKYINSTLNFFYIVGGLIVLVSMYGIFTENKEFENSYDPIIARKVIMYLFALILFILTVMGIFSTIEYYQTGDFFYLLFFLVLGLYSGSSTLVPRTLIEHRGKITIFLSVPGLIFVIVFLTTLIVSEDAFAIEAIYTGLGFFSPVILVNIDLFFGAISKRFKRP